MKLAFLPVSARVASGRLRGLIPAAALRRRGHEVVPFGAASDWVILSKHGWPALAHNGARVCFDVCDDHLDHPEHGAHYRHWIDAADVVTCNSAAMADAIRAKTGRAAVVIDDPYESPERPPKCHAPLLWYGHQNSMRPLLDILPRLPRTVVVCDNPSPKVRQWSPETMAEAFNECGMVVIPTNAKRTKSANRAVEAIRNGLYPCCGRLLAYEELGLGTDDVPREVREMLADPEHTVTVVKQLQADIRDRFSPDTVAKAWEAALCG